MCAQCILTFDLLTGFILFEIIQWEYMKWLIQSFQYRQNGNFSRLWLRRKWFNYTNDPNVITKSIFHLESHSLFVICNLLLYIHFERWIEKKTSMAKNEKTRKFEEDDRMFPFLQKANQTPQNVDAKNWRMIAKQPASKTTTIKIKAVDK